MGRRRPDEAILLHYDELELKVQAELALKQVWALDPEEYIDPSTHPFFATVTC